MAVKQKNSENKKITGESLELLVIENKLQIIKKIKWKRKLINITNKIKGYLKSTELKKAIKKAVFLMLFFLACYISMELLNGKNISFADICIADWEQKKLVILKIIENFFNAKANKFIYNYIVFIFLYLIIYGITNRTKLTCSIIYVSTVVFGVINYIVEQVRGVAISISDIYSLKTAFSVSERIEVKGDGNLIIALVVFAIAMIALCFIKFNDKRKTKTLKRRAITFLIGMICIMSMFSSNKIMDEVGLWDIKLAYEESGANLTLMRMIKDLKIDKPKNYNRKEVQKILENYSDDKKDSNKSNLPNIVVVTNESFFDINDTYNIEIEEDNIPYLHELMNRKNVISGNMHSSTFGGGTANVEYEFLTQNIVGFLPVGTSPYQQYITSDVKQNMIRYMDNLGYNTYGIHPFHSYGYGRFKVYNYLGFKNKMFAEDMPYTYQGLNFYVSDQCTYDNWKDIMNAKQKDEKNFSYILTMQNHLPYVNVDENEIQYVDNEILNSYLQVEHTSDEALKELIEYIDNSEEDTILLFFGDHQPNIEVLKQYEPKNHPIEENKYIIPFVIYANFDIEEKSNIETSANYLQSILLDTVDMPKDSYTKYIEELREELPVLTANYYKDKEGNRYLLDDTTSPYYDKVQEYWKLIYYQIFDSKN